MEQQTEQQDMEDTISTKEEGFGTLFKQVRDEYNLSIDDISRELRLDNHIIIALENEDYKQLPAPAFVCGYIRNYARFLKIQPEPLIDYYKKDCNDEVLSASLSTVKEKRIKNKPRKSVSFVMPLLALFAGAAFIAAGWLLWPYIEKQFHVDKEQTEEETLSAAGDNAPDSLLLPELDSVAIEPIDIETAEHKESLKEDTLAEDGSLLAEEALLSDVSLLSAEGSIPGAIASTETAVINENNNSITEDSLPAEGSLSVEGSEQTTTSDFKADQLVLTFSGNSWIKIKDADNKKLSSGLKKSGETLYLDGRLPYNIFLGDATVATITINGVVFDHSAYINDNKTARFKVK